MIANLKGKEDQFDALVFACGDAVPVFQQHASEPYNVDLMEVIKTFGEKGKMMIGHCAGAMMFDFVGITAVGNWQCIHWPKRLFVTVSSPMRSRRSTVTSIRHRMRIQFGR